MATPSTRTRGNNGRAAAGNKYTRPWRRSAQYSTHLGESFLGHTEEEQPSWAVRVGTGFDRLGQRIWNVLMRLTERGNFSLVVMLLIICTGVVLRYNTYLDTDYQCSSNSLTMLACMFLSAGLFGFIGGFTNWLAVAMLFTRVPFLYGSGVIPSRSQEIRARLRKEMITSIFDGNYFVRYVNQHTSARLASADIPQKISAFMENPEVDSILQRKLDELRDQPEGQLLATIGIQPDDQSTIKPAIVGTCSELAPAVLIALGHLNKTPVQLFRQELDTFITQRVENLDQDTVTTMLETVLRPHLGWIVVWGSFFGMLTGIIVQAVGIAPQY